MPDAIAAINGFDENLRVQDRIAQSMNKSRHIHGVLSFETVEARLILDGDEIRELEVEQKSRAKDIIEEFMIAANGVTARYLSSRKFPSLRRVVRTPINDGNGLSKLPRNTGSSLLISRIQEPWRNS